MMAFSGLTTHVRDFRLYVSSCRSYTPDADSWKTSFVQKSGLDLLTEFVNMHLKTLQPTLAELLVAKADSTVPATQSVMAVERSDTAASPPSVSVSGSPMSCQSQLDDAFDALNFERVLLNVAGVIDLLNTLSRPGDSKSSLITAEVIALLGG